MGYHGNYFDVLLHTRYCTFLDHLNEIKKYCKYCFSGCQPTKVEGWGFPVQILCFFKSRDYSLPWICPGVPLILPLLLVQEPRNVHARGANECTKNQVSKFPYSKYFLVATDQVRKIHGLLYHYSRNIFNPGFFFTGFAVSRTTEFPKP